jgi:hypothetical protein
LFILLPKTHYLHHQLLAFFDYLQPIFSKNDVWVSENKPHSFPHIAVGDGPLFLSDNIRSGRPLPVVRALALFLTPQKITPRRAPCQTGGSI